jgi:CheY-like chemotaxis protein
LSYEAILEELGENLIKASSATEALEQLLKCDIAIILIDVCMPDLDGFQLATMIREHPRFQSLAIIFVSAVQVANPDLLRGYGLFSTSRGAVPIGQAQQTGFAIVDVVVQGRVDLQRARGRR